MNEPISASIIVRSHDPRRMPMLSRALFSAWSQDIAEPLELLLVTSGYQHVLNERICHPAESAGVRNHEPPAPRYFRHVRLDFKGDTRARLLNEGLRQARGPYVYFLDDDDVLREDGLRRLLHLARANDADAVFGRVDIAVTAPGLLPEGRCVVPYAPVPTRKVDLIRYNSAPLCSYILRRSPNELPLVDESLCSHEDYAMLLQVLRRGRIASLTDERAVAEYVQAGGTQPRKYAATLARDLEIISEIRMAAEFSISGRELLEPAHNEVVGKAFYQLVREMPLDQRRLMGFIDHIVVGKHGAMYIGWAASKKPQGSVPLVFAVTDRRATLVAYRFSREDVSAFHGLDCANWGFLHISSGECSEFIAVGDGFRYPIPIGTDARV